MGGGVQSKPERVQLSLLAGCKGMLQGARGLLGCCPKGCLMSNPKKHHPQVLHFRKCLPSRVPSCSARLSQGRREEEARAASGRLEALTQTSFPPAIVNRHSPMEPFLVAQSNSYKHGIPQL